MKQLKMIMILACMPFVMVTAQEEPIPMDTLSYSLGMLQAMELKKQGVTELDQASYMEALNKVLSNEKTAIHGGAAKQFVREYVNNQKEKLDKMNLEAGMNYLEENGKREGVTVLESGLQYEVIQEGSGEIPSAHSTVTTHYTGSLIDGSIFDSSVQRGEPLKFPVGGVIQGWQEALQLMPKGSKWKLYIPQDLAYGSRGAGAVIPPYSALIFEIELLEVE